MMLQAAKYGDDLHTQHGKKWIHMATNSVETYSPKFPLATHKKSYQNLNFDSSFISKLEEISKEK